MKLTVRLFLLLFLLIQSAWAAEDEAYFHNIVRDALSYGKTMKNLGFQLDKSYNFSLQNRPAERLPLMSVDSGLQASARQVANSCVFEHSGTPGVGENLFVVTGVNWTVESAINDWAYEARLLDYPLNAETLACNDGTSGAASRSEIGHYTQQVWQDTTQVGCAAVYCPVISNSAGPMFIDSTTGQPRPSTYFVCHYSPQGNYVNTQWNYLAPYAGVGIKPPVSTPPITPSTKFEPAILPVIQFLLDTP
jgi:hypothetical protein